MALRADEYIVQKVIDIKWVNKSIDHEFKYPLYRVRWAGYNPDKDTWEPYESFNSASIKFVQDFECQFKELYSVHNNQELKEIEASTSVNILSNEIEEILTKRYEKNEKKEIVKTYYRVKWKDSKVENTWEVSDNLCHAQDKIDSFHQKRRVRNNKISISESGTYEEESKRRIEHRKFYNSVDKGLIVLKNTDLYSRVKRGRNLVQKTENVNSKQEKSESDKNNVDKNFYHGNIFEKLPKYDAKRTMKHLVTQAETTFALSDEKFTEAVLNGDYNEVFANMRHLHSEPQVDFVDLFLKTSRMGSRDVAMLLATKVPDLAAEDPYGNSALTMAARQGDALFAHQLLVMGAPLHKPTSQGFTARSVARQCKDENFLRFLDNYEAGTLPF